MNNETRISAMDDGTVRIEHKEPVVTWTMAPAEARQLADHLRLMADEADLNRLGVTRN